MKAVLRCKQIPRIDLYTLKKTLLLTLSSLPPLPFSYLGLVTTPVARYAHHPLPEYLLNPIQTSVLYLVGPDRRGWDQLSKVGQICFQTQIKTMGPLLSRLFHLKFAKLFQQIKKRNCLTLPFTTNTSYTS